MPKIGLKGGLAVAGGALLTSLFLSRDSPLISPFMGLFELIGLDGLPDWALGGIVLGGISLVIYAVWRFTRS